MVKTKSEKVSLKMAEDEETELFEEDKQGVQQSLPRKHGFKRYLKNCIGSCQLHILFTIYQRWIAVKNIIIGMVDTAYLSDMKFAEKTIITILW